MKTLESMAWQCHLLMGIFQCATGQWKWTIDDIIKSDIFAKFKVLFWLLEKSYFNSYVQFLLSSSSTKNTGRHVSFNKI